MGRNGDLCTTLPLVLHDYQQGNKPTVIVSEPWADLMDGVGYADVLVWHGDYSRPLDALAWARTLQKFKRISVPQCYGQNITHECSNFCKEAYRIVGMEHLWGCLPLVFDRRNRMREDLLWPNFQKPVVLVCSTGISHPFNQREKLMETLKPLRDTHELVDMSLVKAHRFYDLLGLLEKAEYLVTVDTGILHLARAVPGLPVITLIPGDGTSWDTAPRFKEHVARISFNEFDQRRGEIVELIQTKAKPQPRFIHVWSDYHRQDQAAERRHRMARYTWEAEMTKEHWTDLRLPDSVFKRNSQTDFGDRKHAPYVTDMIDHAVRQINSWDVVMLTNDDTCVAPGMTSVLRSVLNECGACWGARREHQVVSRMLTKGELMRGAKHVGADVFAFTKSWWQQYGQFMPDMFMAFENWDYVLRTVINDHGGREIEGLCYHETHTGDWTRERESGAARHNQAMGAKFFYGRT